MNHHLSKGILLKSSSGAEDEVFGNSIVLITEVNNDGVTGYIINKLFHRRFNELVEFIDSPPFPLYEGGPMEHEKLFFIHNQPDLIDGGTIILNDTYFGGDFKAAVNYLNMGLLNGQSLKMFIGYCGWDAGQLEQEIEAGEWTIITERNIFQ